MYSASGLYFRPNDNAQFITTERAIFLGPGGKVDFTSYFNQFSVNRWKHYTEIRDVQLLIDFKGEALLHVVINQYDAVEKMLCEVQLSSTEERRRAISLPCLAELPDGLISFRLHTLTSFHFKAASFVTEQPAVRTVHLGIVITAFRRDEYVLPAVERITRELIDDPEYGDRIELAVVDNGGTLIDNNVPDGCRIIQNRNLGGSGGFARGLLYYSMEREGITHCLFMDDDASCDSEAIRRTIAFLGFARNSRTAIAGAMMLENKPDIQHENGAAFDQHCIPLKSGLYLGSVKNLSKNDLIEPIMYGAWWFFAFPLEHVQHYPFPFFVRGDDVAFSCANSFEIATLNGIASLQEPFAEKESPMTVYLDTRQNIVQYLLFQDLKYPAVKILKKFWRTFMKFNGAYQYSSARAVCMALEDALQPASFWEENIDMQKKRIRLSELVANEKLEPMPHAPVASKKTYREAMVRKIVRLLTLNGHLIPKCLMKKQACISKASAPIVKAAYLYQELLIYHYPGRSGFILPHSKRFFFTNIVIATKLSFRTILLSSDLKARRAPLYMMMEPDFWLKQFSIENRAESK